MMYNLSLFAALLFCFGCSKPVASDTANWSKPEVISHSDDSLGSSFMFYKWNNSLMALNNDTKSLELYLLQSDGQHWERVNEDSSFGKEARCTLLNCDPVSNRFISVNGKLIGDKLELPFINGSIEKDKNILINWKSVLQADKTVFFGLTGTNVTLPSYYNSSLGSAYIGGIFNGSAIYIPYCIQGETHHGKGTIMAEGPFDNGVFCSEDDGKTWQIEHISKSFSESPHICKSEKYYYYFATIPADRLELWYSRKAIQGDPWSKPVTITKNIILLGDDFTSVATRAGDTVHVCWLDRRHLNERLLLIDAYHGNYEVAYSRCRDSDGEWSKDVILSKGLKYAYCPVMSLEGDKIVIAWAGAQSAPDGHYEFDPNDIYYVTSNDGGKAWTKPMQVTNGAKDGLTAGRPQVALLNGVIHLFYIQGKMNLKELSPGLVKLNQSPWPIYYTQRPFPD